MKANDKLVMCGFASKVIARHFSCLLQHWTVFVY